MKTKLLIYFIVGMFLMSGLIFILEPSESEEKLLTNTGDAKLISAKSSDGVAIVKMNADDNFGLAEIRLGAIKDLQKASKSIYNDLQFASVELLQVEIYFDLQDTLGKASKGMIMSMSLTRDTFNKLDIENIPHEAFIKAVDSFWQHPSFN